MTDLDLAVKSLPGHTLALALGQKVLTSDKKGIAPMLDFIAGGEILGGFSAADVVVGKAAAMLFVKAGITAVHAVLLSEAGKEFLEQNGVLVTFEKLTSKILNRQGTDICPMEKTVEKINDADEGYLALKQKAAELFACRQTAQA